MATHLILKDAQTSSSTSSSTMSTLPMHLILTEILPKLPAKSLARFKSICKAFNSHISSPDFIFSCPTRLLILPGECHRVFAFDIDSLEAPAFTKFGCRGCSEGCHSISVVGSCDGLLCIFRDYAGPKPLILLNPSSRIYKEIAGDVSRHVVNVGFGFDEGNNDYKIVVVSDFHGQCSVKVRDVKVYSLREDSWSLVYHSCPRDAMEKRYGGVLIDNHLLHWMFWVPSLSKRRIGCFDVRSEQWKDDVLLPDYYYDPRQKNYLLDFGVLDGCLCSSFQNRDDSTYDVWVMKEYGVKDSWIKLLCIPISEDLEGGVVPIAYKSGSTHEVLVRQRHKSNLFWCNTTSNATTRAVSRRLPVFSSLQAYVCKGTVVSIPGGKAL